MRGVKDWKRRDKTNRFNRHATRIKELTRLPGTKSTYKNQQYFITLVINNQEKVIKSKIPNNNHQTKI